MRQALDFIPDLIVMFPQFREAKVFDMTAVANLPSEILSFGGEIWERGLLRLPFEKVIFFAHHKDHAGTILLAQEDHDGIGRRIQTILFIPHKSAEEPDSHFLKYGAFLTEEVAVGIPTGDSVTAFHHSDDETLEDIINLLCHYTGALLSRDCSTVRQGPSDRRLQRSIDQGRQPGTVIHRVVLGEALQRAAEGAASGRHVRMHWRRGHFRDLSSGLRERLVAVSPCIVGSSEFGKVASWYQMKGGTQ